MRTYKDTEPETETHLNETGVEHSSVQRFRKELDKIVNHFLSVLDISTFQEESNL